MKIKPRPSYQNVSDDAMLKDLRRVARRLKRRRLGQTDYDRLGRYNHQVIFRRFGTWGKAMERAGLATAVDLNIEDNDLFYNLLAVWLKLGRRPATSEFRRPLSKFSIKPYLDRFGTWRKAVAVFVAWLRWADPPEPAGGSPRDRDGMLVIENRDLAPAFRLTDHKTPRKPSLRQRFRVMLRDRFRCRLCGRSPATHPGLHLNIDHIVPWSKGGETTDENLQTLCSDCNQGKFDHHPA